MDQFYILKLMKKNFIKFRQSRHFVINNNQNLNLYLHPRNIVTMNMAFNKKLLKDNKIFFMRNLIFMVLKIMSLDFV